MAPKLKVLSDPNKQAPISEAILIQQVGAWADKNFRNKRGAEWGIFEELGEAAHCILKNRQGIRGFDVEEFFLTQLTDALADTIIYLADWCYVHKAFFTFGRNQIHDLHPNQTDERKIVVHLLQGAAQMFSFDEVVPGDKVPQVHEGLHNMAAQRICNGVECWAYIHDINIRLAVAATWAKVSKRDWVANPTAPTPEQT